MGLADRVQHETVYGCESPAVSDVTPMRGVILGGGEQELEVRVTVTPM